MKGILSILAKNNFYGYNILIKGLNKNNLIGFLLSLCWEKIQK